MNDTVSPLASRRRDMTAGTEQKGSKVNDRIVSATLAALAAVLLCGIFAGPASASGVRPFKEVFGSAAQPTFIGASSLAVSASSGDLLVINGAEATVERFNPDGTPAPFPDLGTNVIDAAEGGGGKPCSEEPESCDKTPENGFSFGSRAETQIAIDNSGGPTDGNIYVTQGSRRLIDIFGQGGSYLGQLTGSSSGPLGEPCGVAAGPDGAVYVGDYIGGEVHKYVTTGSAPTNADNTANFDFPGSPCTVAAGVGPSAGYIFPAQYNGAIYKMNADTGEMEYRVSSEGTVTESVNPSNGNLFVAHFGTTVEYDVSGSAEAVQVSHLQAPSGFDGVASNEADEVFVSNFTAVEVFGSAVPLPTLTATDATEVTGTTATLNGLVDPEGLTVEECFFEWGESTAYGNVVPCEGSIPTDSENHPVQAEISGLAPNGVTYHYRLVAKNEHGAEYSADKTLSTAATVVTNPATGLGEHSATLNGTVRPEGQAYTECVFEYGLTSTPGYEDSAECEPAAGSIPVDFEPHAVSAALIGLEANATYKFRLKATNAGGTVVGQGLTFETQGPPRVLLTRSRDADQHSVTLEASINPKGSDSTYRFEWGPTSSYGNSVPATPESIGSGESPVSVSDPITGLSPATVYHYRVVSESTSGTTEGPDHTAETLNSCGLPDKRCFELVSRRDAGPVATVEPDGSSELPFQAATLPGALAYSVETGYPDATKGANILYRGTRSSDEWDSIQLSAPITAHDETTSSSSGSSKTRGLSEDLSCGIVESAQPLRPDEDAAAMTVIEAGGANLYRHNPDGSWTLITDLAPENPQDLTGLLGYEYKIQGFSQDCGTVLFSTLSRYAGVPGGASPSGDRLYEWKEGTLRGAGFIPGPSGEVEASAQVGHDIDYSNGVSADGSRVFLTATRQTSPNPAEIGSEGIFVREGGSVRDISLSETSTPDTHAVYQSATKDGSRVFFTANAGITPESSGEGTDLYEYDLESEELTDLTVSDEEGGAGVVGLIGTSEDGSHYYFVARGQLVPGQGNSFAQNQEEGTLSVYSGENGEFKYAGAIREAYPRSDDNGLPTTEDQVRRVLVERPESQTSRVSPDGRYLLFESSLNITGYDSGNGIMEAYLFDSEATSEATVCVSCRQDGAPSHSLAGSRRLEVGGLANPFSQPRSLFVLDGAPIVIFSAADRLAPGGVDELTNVYEWAHGQVFRIDTEPPDLQEDPISNPFNYAANLNSRFLGASLDGTDIYLRTPQTLTWEDGDRRGSAYDVRIGGGFPEPPAPTPCDPESEGSCQAPSSGSGPAVPPPGSSAYVGPGNPKPKKAHRKRHKKHRKHHHKKKHHKKRQRQLGALQVNANRRAGK